MIVRFARCTAGTALALSLLTACGGGQAGGGSPVVPQTHSTTGQVQFTMHWPGKTDLAKLKHPLFISPSTMSIVIEVDQGSNSTPYSTAIFANPSKNGQPTTSTVSINAPVGDDTIWVSLYDVASPNPEAGQGNELGQAEVPATIVAGKTNTIGLTIQGILSKIGIAPLPNQSFLVAGTDNTGAPTFEIVGDQPSKVAVTPLDADGNVIVAPGTVPSISLTSSDSSIAVTALSGNANEYTVQAVVPTASGVNPTLVAKGTDGNGFTAQSSVPCTQVPALFVASENSGTGSITLIDQAKHTYPTSGFPGVADPKAIAYDADDHRLFVADATSNKVLAFNTDGSAAASFTPISFTGATALAYDGTTKHLFVTGPSATTVGVFTASGSPVSVSGAWTGLVQPNGIAVGTPFGSPETVYVTSATAGNSPLEFDTNGNSTGASLTQAATSASTGIAFDPTSSDPWVTSTGTPPAALTQYGPPFGGPQQSITSNLTTPVAVLFNSLNNELYVVDRGANDIVTFSDQDPASMVTTVTWPSSITNPTGVAIVP